MLLSRSGNGVGRLTHYSVGSGNVLLASSLVRPGAGASWRLSSKRTHLVLVATPHQAVDTLPASPDSLLQPHANGQPQPHLQGEAQALSAESACSSSPAAASHSSLLEAASLQGAASMQAASGAGQQNEPSPASSADDVSNSTNGAAVAPKKKSSSFMNRVIFGTLLGFGGGAVVILGNWALLAVALFITFQATREYYGMITSKAITKKMAPPSPLITFSTHMLNVSIVLLAHFHKGRSGTALAVAAFLLLVLQVVATKRPKFSQLASSLFGLFYCGWLPSFWVKLRSISAAAPAIPYTGWIAGFSEWTVGMLAMFMAVACVIAADTGAYFVGKALGRTKLTDISPKKTVEGAVGGWASSVAVSLGLCALTQWPATPLAAAGFGTLVFFSSLFGDLLESIIKRDAEMKDSGDLIPGHGGLLDRVDSYMFTGAVAYFYCVFILPNYGLVLA